MGDIRNVYKIWTENLKGRNHLEGNDERSQTNWIGRYSPNSFGSRYRPLNMVIIVTCSSQCSDDKGNNHL
jgi:hypothetical protein